ncbi:hypothetical protein ACPVTF_18030 [Geobacillus icigianus]|uniref:Uncharacterized protein n=1 Tax=Geobacillus subterraneus TaxID=129338 RepID=A0A679FMN3_9BACL|nr:MULTISPECIES: hypothetical protein [Geobacillus]KYD25899.1 hypothetical protein B4113_1570 [Geobacillus sp. B4113_201601]BBW97832.1 hypothetical protein GsuE55_26650 [Geobacillus subterraneus]
MRKEADRGLVFGCLFSKKDGHFFTMGRILPDDAEKENTKRILVR